MDADLKRIAIRSLLDAEARGGDYMSMTETALRQIRMIRPDISDLEALSALNHARRDPERAGAA